MRYSVILMMCTGLAFSAWLGAGTAEAGSEGGSLLQVLIDSADSPAEHEALAKYYRSEAAEARGMAEKHRSMGQRYSGGKLTQKQRMRKHCDALANSFDQLATEYDGLAASHSEAATP